MIKLNNLITLDLAATGLIGGGNFGVLCSLIILAIIFTIGSIILLSNIWSNIGDIYGFPGDDPDEPMPGVKCIKCEDRGVESWVLPGKHCPKCGHPC